MSKEKTAVDTRPDKKKGQKTSSTLTGATTAQVGLEVAAAPEWVPGPGSSGSLGGADGQASRLCDPRLAASQRQSIARQIARQQGNAHLQRLIVSLHRDTASAHPRSHEKSRGQTGQMDEASSDDVLEGLGQNGLAAAAAGVGAPRPGNHGGPAVLQRQEEGEEGDEPTEEEKAIALANAARAEGQAGQSADQAQSETGKSKAEAQREAQNKESAMAEAAALQGESAALKGEAAAAGGEAGAPQNETAQSAQGETGSAGAAESAGAAPAAGGGAPASPALAQGGGLPGTGADQAKAPASAKEDPAFQAVVQKAKVSARVEKKHAPGKAKAAAAQTAAVMPGSEKLAHAQNDQANKMDSTPTPGFNGAAFKARLMERIAQSAPKNAQETDAFKGSGKLDGVKGDMQNQTAAESGNSTAPLEQASGEAPDTASVPEKPVAPLEVEQPGAPAGVAGAEGAAPKSKTGAEVEAPMKAETNEISDKMVEADITEEQLEKSNEPEFQDALKAKKEAKDHAETSPVGYRQFEQAELGKAQGEAAATAQEKTQAMHNERGVVFTQVSGRQGQAKTEDEQARARIAADIQSIYAKTKTSVEQILGELDGKVSTAFDSGAAAAKQAFESFVDARMEAYKERRYGGWFGWARWAKDKLAGMPAEVNAFYTEGRNLFLQKMDAVIDTVVQIIGNGLAEAKAEIANGKKEIGKYVAGLPKDLQKVGQQAASGLEEQFAGLERTVDAKQDELIETLSSKYQEHLQAVDARIDEMKAANRGLVDKAIDAVVGVIKVILKLKDMLMTVLAKIADVVGKIIRDPIGFLGNLISGIKQGFMNFVGNVMTHLQTGLIGWLTGALGPMGIQLPDDLFSLEGIFSLVVQVLGVSWGYIRAKAVKLLGEPVVKVLETGFEVFKILLTEGPAGLWKLVQDQFSNLKEMVIEEIKNMVITEVIKAGVKWILSLLNPAGALVKAAMAIYDIVMFFIERGSQVMELVNAVVDGVGAIARGAVGGAAALIENALAKALPVVIGFLANLLGLGGLAKKVQGIITKMRDKIDKAIESILLKAKKFAGKAMRKLGFGKKGEKEQGAEGMQSAALIGEVKQEVANRSRKPFRDMTEAQGMVQNVFSEYQPKGLKSLRLIEKKGAEGKSFEVIATASPPQDVGDVNVELADELAGDPEEIIDVSLWEEVAANMSGGQEAGTKLSERSYSYNLTVLSEMIAKSPADAAKKSEARAKVLAKLAQAMAAEDGDSIYRRLQEASAVVNRLYKGTVVQLQVHHEERVKQNPATFPKTRMERKRSQIAARVKKGSKSLQPGEKEIMAVADVGRRRELLRIYVEGLLIDEIDSGPASLPEVEMDVMTREAHLGGAHHDD